MDPARPLSHFLVFSLVIACLGAGWSDQSADSVRYKGVIRDIPEEFREYDKLCDKAEQVSATDSILGYSEAAIKIADETSLNPARALILKGNGLLLAGKVTLAVECFTAAANAYGKVDNPIGIATAYTYLSEAYISQQNHNNVKLYLNRAIRIFDTERDSLRLAFALHNLGFEYYRIEQYDSALILFDRAGEVYRKLNYELENAYCTGNTGLVYSRMDDLTRAENNLLKALKTIGNYNDARALSDFTLEYAYVLQRKGNIGQALASAYKGLDLASENNITELKRDAAFRLSQIYEEIKRYDSAFHYQLIYYTYSDSIRNLESIQRTADLRTEFEVARKQAEVDILKKNKSIQRIVIGGLGTIILLGAGFIIMIFLSLKRNRRLRIDLEARQRQLEEQSAELRKLNRIKDRFFSIISHDLRSPLSSLGGISSLIKESLENDNKALLNQATEYIDQTVISLTGLLENLLNWALSQQGKFPFKPESVDLEDMIREVVKTFTSVTLTKNQSIDLHLEKMLTIEADRNSMMTIIRNLVSNALKFTPSGGNITITTAGIQNNMAEIRVADNGIGIPAEKIDDLFKLKEDKSSRGTQNEKGIGLGLNLVYEFTRMNKGTIRVESRVNQGTTFIVVFPMKILLPEN
jgi:two-component system NtrC family sensor kinase